MALRASIHFQDANDESDSLSPFEPSIFATTSTVLDHLEVGPGVHRMEIGSADVARRAVPGQFVNVRPPWDSDPLLPRPFSIHERLRDGGGEVTGLAILYRVTGRGTALMASMKFALVVITASKSSFEPTEKPSSVSVISL